MQKVHFIPLNIFEDERGSVMHYLKKNDVFFKEFGESYFSWINPNYIKGWYKHNEYTSFISCPTLNLKIVFYDSSGTSEPFEIIIDNRNYGVIVIEPNIWYSFKSLDAKPALVSNVLTGPYKTNEVEKLEIDSKTIPYKWFDNA